MRAASSLDFGGAMYPFGSGTYPLAGFSGACFGACSLNVLPSEPVRESVSGLKLSLPARPYAMTISGLPMKASVLADPSLRLGKLRLYDVTMVFSFDRSASGRFHWP